MLEWLKDLFSPVFRVDSTGTTYVAAQPNLYDIDLRARAHMVDIEVANVGLTITTEHVLSQKSIIWAAGSIQTSGAQTGTNWYIDVSFDSTYSHTLQVYPNLKGGSLTGYMGGGLLDGSFPMVVPAGTRFRMRSAVAAGAYTFKNTLLITEL